MIADRAAVREAAYAVLDAAWDDIRGYCFPNAATYPHLWLWDSAFHAIAWAAVGDPRARRELHAIFAAQFPHGLVPHMTYSGPTMERGPLGHASSFTQPPVYAHAARVLVAAGIAPGPGLLGHVDAALEYLWQNRMRDGLLYVVHPWEAGSDDSPRWDSWVGSTEWQRDLWTAFDLTALHAVHYDEEGAAATSEIFEVAPAAFNAIAVHASREHVAVGGDRRWTGRAIELAETVDARAWNDREGLWSDVAFVGGGPSRHVPTLDGVLGALSSDDDAKAHRALDQLLDPTRFAAPFGPTYVARSHEAYRPAEYWRGSAWPQLAYLVWCAARRWDRSDVAELIARSTIAGAMTSGFSEHWNPETGDATGATPQTWAAVVAAMAEGT